MMFLKGGQAVETKRHMTFFREQIELQMAPQQIYVTVHT